MATFEITQGDKTFSVDVPEGVDANAVLAQFPEASAVLKQFPPGSPPPAPLGDAVIDEPSEAPGRTIPEQIARGTGLGLRTVAGVIPKTATGIADLAAMALNVPIAGLDKLGQLLGDEPLDVRLPTGATASLDEALSQIFPTPETLGEKIAVGTGEVALTGGAGAAALAPKLGAVTKNPAVQSIIRNLGDEIGAFFAKSPKTAGALEATSGVGAVGAGAAGQHLGAFRRRILDQAIDILDRPFVHHGPQLDAGLETRTDLERRHCRGEFIGEFLIDAFVRIEAIRRRARFAAVTHLRDHRAHHRGVDIRVVEHEKRRVAAQLHRAVDDTISRLSQQSPAHFGGTGEGQLARERMVQHRANDFT